MTPVNLCWFQNDSTKKYRLLCLEATDDGRCLWETNSDVDHWPDPRTDILSVVRRPAHYSDYEQRWDEIVEGVFTIVTQQ